MSLYTKYRPSDFGNLVGQKFIKETLKTAIANNKLVGAYLFCGPRGTGKTSTARLLAKTINCLNPKNGNPCLECEICKDFVDEKLIDIIEIDAASHTGVDNIREIIEKAQFLPTKTKFKVYIIDEVHMLSKGAFNALLKILEEPPSYVKFILATTEIQKIPETIISRCQRYDFRRIGKNDIIERLKFISKNEGIQVDNESYEYIANHSNGGLRNAISLYEQLIIDKKITYDDIIEKLGLIGKEELEKFLQKLIEADNTVVDDFNLLISNGKNIKLFFKELIFYIKDKIFKRLKNGEEILKYLKIIEVLDETYTKTKNSLDESTTFVIGILKITNGNGLEKKEFTDVKPKLVENSMNVKISESTKNITPIKGDNLKVSKEDLEVLFSVDNNVKLQHSIETNTLNSNNSGISTNSNFYKNDISNFNVNTFISNLKSAGAKGALTMALRGTEMLFKNNNLTIKIKNQISRKSIENTESITLIREILSNMGYQEAEVNII